jgi:hypothetical protein
MLYHTTCLSFVTSLLYYNAIFYVWKLTHSANLPLSIVMSLLAFISVVKWWSFYSGFSKMEQFCSCIYLEILDVSALPISSGAKVSFFQYIPQYIPGVQTRQQQPIPWHLQAQLDNSKIHLMYCHWLHIENVSFRLCDIMPSIVFCHVTHICPVSHNICFDCCNSLLFSFCSSTFCSQSINQIAT